MLRRVGGHAVTVGKILTKSKKRMLLVGLLLLASGVLISQCGGGGGGGGGGGADTNGDGDEEPGQAGIRIASDGAEIIAQNAPIVFAFETAMDRDSLVLGGPLAETSHSVTWSDSGTETLEDDTLTVSPAATWPIGFDKMLTIDVKNADGEALHSEIAFDVFEKVWYVHPDGNNETADGTTAMPYKTIQVAIDNNKNGISDYAILVAEGLYASAFSNGEGSEVVLMRPGFSLYGGYSGSDWSRRDSAAYPSILRDTSTGEAEEGATNRAVTVPAAITNQDTHIEGFTIEGARWTGEAEPPPSAAMSAIYVDGGSATIRDNVMDGGSGFLAFGIMMMNGCAPRIERNTIRAGSLAIMRVGIAITDCAGVVSGNSIRGGTDMSLVSQGVIIGGTAEPQITGNDIDAGSCAMACVGLMISDPATAAVEGNTIRGGVSTEEDSGSLAISIGTTGSPEITNNRIHGGDAVSYSAGVSNTDGNAVIEGNTITVSGMAAAATTYGVHVTGGAPTLLRNHIQGGGGSESFGIEFEGNSEAPIANNTIHGGSGTASFGVRVNGGVVIAFNTIFGGTGTAAKGVTLGVESNPDISNNVIFGAGDGDNTCVWEDESSGPSAFYGNDLFGCSPLYVLHAGDWSDLNSISAIETALVGQSGGNVSANPRLADIDGPDGDVNTMVDNDWQLTATRPAVPPSPIGGAVDNDWHLTAATPCTVSRGAHAHLSMDDDKDAQARPGADSQSSMGAYEHDGTCAE